MPIAVEFNHVSKRFFLNRARSTSVQETLVNLFRRNKVKKDEFWVLKDISFQLAQGKTFGFIGENGAGKSTALKLVSRIIPPTSGQINTTGRIGALLELGAGFHPDLTGRENIYLNASVLGLSRVQINQKIDAIIDFSELERFIDVPVKHYSSGMYVRLGFSVAVHTDPEILLVDEVLAVGDVNFQKKCLDRVNKLRRSGVTIVLVSHSLELIQSMCSEVLWFCDGAIKDQGLATDVVMSYINHMIQQAAQSSADTNADTAASQDGRWGSGEVRIVKVEMCTADGQPSKAFNTGDPMQVRLYYEAAEPMEEPVFGLGIHHQNGVHICGPNTRFGEFSIPKLQGTGVVTYRIPQLNLLEGSYLLSVSVSDKTLFNAYDTHDRLYAFQVNRGNSKESFGFMTLDGAWSREPDKNSV